MEVARSLMMPSAARLAITICSHNVGSLRVVTTIAHASGCGRMRSRSGTNEAYRQDRDRQPEEQSRCRERRWVRENAECQ